MNINDLGAFLSQYSTSSSLQRSTHRTLSSSESAPSSNSTFDQILVSLSGGQHQQDNNTYDLQQMQRVAAAAMAQQANAATQQADDANAPVVKSVRGIDVIVENHSRDIHEGETALRTLDSDDIESWNKRLDNVSMEVTPGMTVSQSVALTAADVRAYQDINPGTVSNQFSTEQRLTTYQLIKGLPWEQQYADNVDQYMELVGAERELKARYGDGVKLQYSHADNGYVMLTPDDAGYEHASSAEAGVEWILKDVENAIIDPDLIRDSLEAYGYFV